MDFQNKLAGDGPGDFCQRALSLAVPGGSGHSNKAPEIMLVAIHQSDLPVGDRFLVRSPHRSIRRYEGWPVPRLDGGQHPNHCGELILIHDQKKIDCIPEINRVGFQRYRRKVGGASPRSTAARIAESRAIFCAPDIGSEQDQAPCLSGKVSVIGRIIATSSRPKLKRSDCWFFRNAAGSIFSSIRERIYQNRPGGGFCQKILKMIRFSQKMAF